MYQEHLGVKVGGRRPQSSSWRAGMDLLCILRSPVPWCPPGNQCPTRSILKMKTSLNISDLPRPELESNRASTQERGCCAPRGVFSPRHSGGAPEWQLPPEPPASWVARLSLPGMGRFTPGQPLFLPFYTVRCVLNHSLSQKHFVR